MKIFLFFSYLILMTCSQSAEIARLAVGLDVDTFSEFAKDSHRVEVVEGSGDSLVAKGFDCGEYTIDKHLLLKVCFSKISRKIESIRMEIVSPGAHVPKDSKVIFQIERIGINDNGSVSVTLRTQPNWQKSDNPRGIDSIEKALE